jgi:hypothetical protein
VAAAAAVILLLNNCVIIDLQAGNLRVHFWKKNNYFKAFYKYILVFTKSKINFSSVQYLIFKIS